MWFCFSHPNYWAQLCVLSLNLGVFAPQSDLSSFSHSFSFFLSFKVSDAPAGFVVSRCIRVQCHWLSDICIITVLPEFLSCVSQPKLSIRLQYCAMTAVTRLVLKVRHFFYSSIFLNSIRASHQASEISLIFPCCWHKPQNQFVRSPTQWSILSSACSTCTSEEWPTRDDQHEWQIRTG